MNIMKEIKCFTYLLKLSKWLYFMKKIVMVLTLAFAVFAAITCCCNCKDVCSCCKNEH